MTYWISNNSGDQDSVIPLTGSRTLVHGLAEELGLKTSVPYRVWFEGQQVNLIENFSNSITTRCYNLQLKSMLF